MSESRTKIQSCNLCQAIWEGADPPAVCPHCKAPADWTAAEVGTHPGMVGGRVFVPGTDTPMTRMLLCKACRKLHVVRRGGAVPTTCEKCGCAEFLESGNPAAAPSALGARPAPTEGPTGNKLRRLQERQATRGGAPYVPPASTLFSEGAASASLPTVSNDYWSDRARKAEARVAELEAECKSLGDGLLAANEAIEQWGVEEAAYERQIKTLGQECALLGTQGAPQVSPEDYRKVWVAERVAAWLDREGGDLCNAPEDGRALVIAQLWKTAAECYDAGREQGYLP
jgi:hypothetical protein